MPPTTAPLHVLVGFFLLQIVNADYKVDVLLQRFVDAEGKLINGSYCDPFYFVGYKCNIQLKICVQLPGQANCSLTDSTGWFDLGQVAANDYEANFTKDQTYGAWYNPATFSGTGAFSGFSIGVQAFSLTNSTANKIDEFVLPVTDGSIAAASNTTSHNRFGAQPTSLQLAWRATGDVITPPPPTAEPYTGPTTEYQSTPAPAPFDCDSVPETARAGRTEGVFTLNFGLGNVQAYCLFGTNGAYTVIQNRGEGDDTDFNATYEEYQSPIGFPGALKNFWLGLDNINALTTSTSQRYHLRVDLCCSSTHPLANYVYNVGNNVQNYTLNGTPGNKAGFGANDGSPGDIGADFSTRDRFRYDDLEYCEVIASENSTGSCANNLNGARLQGDPTTCQLSGNPKASGAGVEFATSTNNLGPNYIDGKSYTRTRVALYRNSNSIITGFPEEYLCQYTNPPNLPPLDEDYEL